MSGSKWLADKALAQLRNVPRITIPALNEVGRKPVRRPRGKKAGGYDYGTKNPIDRRNNRPPIGYEHMIIPKAYKTQVEKHYNHGWDSKRQYPPLSLQTLQLMIDTGRLDTTKPIDLAAICNTKVFPLEPKNRHFGINLTDEGVDNFEAKLNLEVQYASEQAIAAIERNGGVITTAYFDINCVMALANPLKWFTEGKPIPRRLQPPADAIKYYSDAKNRGYLAHPEQIQEERFILAQKYGYEVSEITEEFLRESKDPRQVFYGLEPGWLINLADKEIYKPTDPELIDYYKS